MTTIQHIGYRVGPGLMFDETRFWWLLGFERVTRPEPKLKGAWLWSGSLYIHLLPVPLAPYVDEWNHIALVPRLGYEQTLRRLEQQTDLTIIAEHAETWWGARRCFIHSPSSYRVELIQFAPPARVTGPPETD